jgi:hypothetical protein
MEVIPKKKPQHLSIFIEIAIQILPRMDFRAGARPVIIKPAQLTAKQLTLRENCLRYAYFVEKSRPKRPSTIANDAVNGIEPILRTGALVLKSKQSTNTGDSVIAVGRLE